MRIVMAHLNERNVEGNDRIFVGLGNEPYDFPEIKFNIEQEFGIRVTQMYLCEIDEPLETCCVLGQIVLARSYPSYGTGWRVLDKVM